MSVDSNFESEEGETVGQSNNCCTNMFFSI